jgi:hypothetical protein
LGVGQDLIHIVRSRGDKDPNSINFDIEMSEAHGRGGIGGVLPTSRTGPTPTATVTVGPTVFYSETRLKILSTIIHETEHFSHATRSVELLKNWRRSASRMTFEDWLRREYRNRRISKVEYDLVIERIQDGEDATQTLAYLEGFISMYHRVPITHTITRFEQIDQMARYWARAGHAINEESIRRLAEYFRSLDEAYKTDFAAHARTRQRTVRTDIPEFRLFWDRVVRDVLSQ